MLLVFPLFDTDMTVQISTPHIDFSHVLGFDIVNALEGIAQKEALAAIFDEVLPNSR